MIHPTAVVHPQASLGAEVEIGPYSVIEEGVTIGRRSRIGPHVHLCSGTILGSENELHSGCVLGDAPQDKNYKGDRTILRIGDHNIFREHVTIHRSNTLSEETQIGSHNYFMAGSHVGHNAVIGDHVVLANGALLGGHVKVSDQAFISAYCLVHQFVRIGVLTLMQGSAGLSKDLPPYTIARGHNGTCGLNVIGLRRAGFSAEARLELKRLYHLLFRRGLGLRTAVEIARKDFQSDPARVLLDFIAASRRGVCGFVPAKSPGKTEVDRGNGSEA